jgi:hypothetical protein
VAFDPEGWMRRNENSAAGLAIKGPQESETMENWKSHKKPHERFLMSGNVMTIDQTRANLLIIVRVRGKPEGRN